MKSAAAVSHPHNYRADIDGLRAVAIVSVVAYHAGAPLLHGGFVGVDVFFVISGFLISQIVFKALDHGRFSFSDFYIRRVRRIFPALAVILLFVLVAGYIAMLADEYSLLGLHVAAGAISLQNIQLWTEAGYFDVVGDRKPLLHLWSLGIEEQFYLAWPLFVVLLGRSARILGSMLLVLTAVSFAAGMEFLLRHPDAAFYLPLARSWELMIGCWLANAQRGDGDGWPARFHSASLVAQQKVREASSIAGLALIAFAVVALNGLDSFPGWRAALPTVGAALLIQAGPTAKINRSVLGHPVAVFIGAISYPLYLWHWPLLSFATLVKGTHPAAAVRGGLVVAAVLLAWLTSRWVELPLRSRTARVPTAIALIGIMILLALAGVAVNRGAIEPRSAAYGLDQIVRGAHDAYSPPETLEKIVWLDNDFLTVGNGPKVTLLLGDSHAMHYYARVHQLLLDGRLAGRRVVFGAYAWCPPIPRVLVPMRPDCEQIRASAFAYALQPEVDTVVVAADWETYLHSNHQPFMLEHAGQKLHINVGSEGFGLAMNNLEGFLKTLEQNGKRVYLVLQIPQSPMLDPKRAVDRDFPHFNFKIVPAQIDTAAMRARFGPMVGGLRAAGARAGVTVIDPLAILCNDEVCPVLTPNGMPIYQDGSHLNEHFVRQHLRYLDTAFGVDRSATR